MLQFDYRNSTYIIGKIDQVILRLKELERQFKTVREYLDFQTRALS